MALTMPITLPTLDDPYPLAARDDRRVSPRRSCVRAQSRERRRGGRVSSVDRPRDDGIPLRQTSARRTRDVRQSVHPIAESVAPRFADRGIHAGAPVRARRGAVDGRRRRAAVSRSSVVQRTRRRLHAVASGSDVLAARHHAHDHAVDAAARHSGQRRLDALRVGFARVRRISAWKASATIRKRISTR